MLSISHKGPGQSVPIAPRSLYNEASRRSNSDQTCICIPGSIAIQHSLIPTTSPIHPHKITALHLLAPEITRLQIPRHTRQLHNQPIQLLAHADLTSKPRSLRQPKRQIQHIIFIIAGLFHLVEHLLGCYHNMASRAGARATAGAFHFEIVGLRDVEQVVAVGDAKSYF